MNVTFLGIGVQKAATSWLHEILSLNPDLEASEPKELNYFSANFDRGEIWYEGHFTDPAAKARGECSPTYFYDLDAPARAYDYNPDMRLIAVLRDPVDRAFSNHLHEIRKGHIGSEVTFEDALRRNSAYVEQGRYARHLARWIETFGRAPLLVLLAEEIAGDPDTAYKAVCAHLGVPAHDLGEALRNRSHESIGRRNKTVARVLRQGGDTLRAIGFGEALRSLKKSSLIRPLIDMNNLDLRKEITPMQAETRVVLEREFEPDLRYVADLLGRDHLPWKTWTSLFPSPARSELRVSLETIDG